MSKTIGVVGLGIMGGAFAKNLVAAGWRVIGCDLEPARCAEARAAGIEIADGAAAVAEAASDIITSLPTAQAVLETARAIAGAKGRGRTVIETSTLALADKTEVQRILAQAGHAALDCPISGTGSQAKVKDIVVYASGDAAAIARLEPAFLGFARKVYNLGAYGNGSKMKFVANHLVAIHNVAAAEAMVLGHEGRPRPAQGRGSCGLRRRHLARVRAARAHDGREHLSPRHHALDHLGEGPRRDRRLRLLPRLPDAAVRPVGVAACGRARHGPRRRGHRRGVRGVRGHGWPSAEDVAAREGVPV